MATWNTVFSFSAALGNKVHNMATDTFKVVLCAAANAPTTATTKLSDLTTIDMTNIPNRTLTITSFAQASGVAKWIVVDFTLQATGGTVPTWRYAAVYDDTATNDEVIGWLDKGGNVDMTMGQTELLDFSAANGVLQVAVVQ